MNTAIETVLAWLGHCSWQVTVLVGFVLLAQRLLRARLTPHWRHALWWLVIARLLMPVVPESPFSLFNMARLERPGRVESSPPPELKFGHRAWKLAPDARASRGNIAPTMVGVTPTAPVKSDRLQSGEDSLATLPPLPPPAIATRPGKLSISRILILLWGLGVAVMVARVGLGNYRFAHQLRQDPALSRTPVRDLLAECQQLMAVRSPLTVVETPDVDSPALYGFFRLQLLLPTAMTRTFSPAELRHIFLHELAHLRRRDVQLNWLMTLLQCVHWFNPAVWFAFARMRADRELACDALALAHLRAEENQTYGRTVIKLLENLVRPARRPGLVGILENTIQIKRRINMIAQYRKAQPWSILALVLLMALGLLTLTDAQMEKGSANPRSQSLNTNAVIEPKTGLAFTVAKTLDGNNDRISTEDGFALWPNGRFLHWQNMVIPLDGAAPLRFTDRQVQDSACSPDGRWIAFTCTEGLYVVPLEADTGKPSGAARKLGDRPWRWSMAWYDQCLAWTRDSTRVVFFDAGGMMRAFPISEDDASEWYDLASLGILSPDGSMVAYSAWGTGIWIKPTSGGKGRCLSEQGEFNRCEPIAWSADGQWIIGRASLADNMHVRRFVRHELRFLHVPDGKQYVLPVPVKAGAFVEKAGASGELYFYQPSYESRIVPRFVSLEGGQTQPMSLDCPLDLPGATQWSPDGTILIVITKNREDQARCWLLPVSGATRREFKLDAPELREIKPERFDPSCRRLLFTATAKDGQTAYYVAPVSLEQGKIIGSAVKLCAAYNMPPVWSPNGSQLSIVKDGQLWVVSSDGKEWSLPLPNVGDIRIASWLPDGTQLFCFSTAYPGPNIFYVVPAKGGAARTIPPWPLKSYRFCGDWVADSKSFTVLVDGVLRNVPINVGPGEELLRLQKLGFNDLSWGKWSPDGQYFAFYAIESAKERDELFVLSAQDHTARKLAAQDHWPARGGFVWSPDSRRLAYSYEDRIKARPAGVLYRFDAEAALKKIKAGTISGLSIVEPKADESATTPPAEPIPGPIFTDNFDRGLSQHWHLQKLRAEGSEPDLPPEQTIQNGELVLTHARVWLDDLDWTNYVVKVRFCVKHGGGRVGLCARTTPSKFGFLGRDRYDLSTYCEANKPGALSLQRNFYTASNELDWDVLGGSTPLIIPDKWYTLEFQVRDQHLRTYLDGKLVIEVTDKELVKGGVMLGAWSDRAHFDDFSVRQLP